VVGPGPGGWIVFAGELRSMGYLGDAAARCGGGLRHRLGDPLWRGCTAQWHAVNPRYLGQTIASQDCDLREPWGGD
jgi:hypothetical protein